MATARRLLSHAPWASPRPVALRGCPSGGERRATERSLVLPSPTWLAVKEACPHSVRRQSQHRQPPPSSRSLTPPSPCACASRSTDRAEATTASRSPSTRNSSTSSPAPASSCRYRPSPESAVKKDAESHAFDDESERENGLCHHLAEVHRRPRLPRGTPLYEHFQCRDAKVPESRGGGTQRGKGPRKLLHTMRRPLALSCSPLP